MMIISTSQKRLSFSTWTLPKLPNGWERVPLSIHLKGLKTYLGEVLFYDFPMSRPGKFSLKSTGGNHSPSVPPREGFLEVMLQSFLMRHLSWCITGTDERSVLRAFLEVEMCFFFWVNKNGVWKIYWITWNVSGIHEKNMKKHFFLGDIVTGFNSCSD